jgi:hypothetical protein
LESIAANDPGTDANGDMEEDDGDEEDASWDMAEGVDEELTKSVLQKTSRHVHRCAGASSSVSAYT